MDARFFDEVDDALVSTFVLQAHVLHQIEQQFSAQHLVSMHPRNVSELWFACRGGQNTAAQFMTGGVKMASLRQSNSAIKVQSKTECNPGSATVNE